MEETCHLNFRAISEVSALSLSFQCSFAIFAASPKQTVNGRNRDAVYIPQEDLPVPQKYTFTVRMTNFLCFPGEETLYVEKSLTNPPFVTLGTPRTQTVTRGDTITMSIDAYPSLCLNESSARSIGFSSWVDADGKAVNATNDPKRLIIPPYTLDVGQTYSFAIETFMSEAPDLKVVSTFTVAVESGPVVAIVGGDRSLHAGSEFVVDAGASRNFDFPLSEEHQHLHFKWSCFYVEETNMEFYDGISCLEVEPLYDGSNSSVLKVKEGLFIAEDLKDDNNDVTLVFSVCVEPRNSFSDVSYCDGGIIQPTAPSSGSHAFTSLIAPISLFFACSIV